MRSGKSIRLVRHDPSNPTAWSRDVLNTRIPHFQFHRNFMDYHADRFTDHSFRLTRNNRTLALLPAHRTGERLVSHDGLTFGGWLPMPDCRTTDLKTGFEQLAEHMRRDGLSELLYTPVPHPYHVSPSEDDRYLLQILGARIVSSQLAAFAARQDPEASARQSKRRYGKLNTTCPFLLRETDDIERFWEHLARFLDQRHGAAPVHNAAEMRLLKSRFPKNIRLFVAEQGNEWRAGIVIFHTVQVLRYQYAFRDLSYPTGDWIHRSLDRIRMDPMMNRSWLDMGTSIDPATGQLNSTLHDSKEWFGARGVAIHTWQWTP